MFASWLNRITVNESVSWLRKRQRVVQHQQRMAYPSYLVPTPHQEFEQKELDAAVRKALGSLSKKNRLAITLYYIDGLSQREVANFLGISISAVENRISRARKQLKEEMMKMVEGTFKSNRLPDDFAKRVQESLDQGNAALFFEPDKALEYYQRTLDLCSRMEEQNYGSMCRAAIALLKEVGTSPGTDKLIECRAVSDVLEKTSASLIHLREPGFGRCHMRTDYRWEEAFRVGLIHSLKVGDNILNYSFRVGHGETMEDFSFTSKPLIATRIVENDSETVGVIAGAFEDCLKVKTVLRPSPCDDGTKRNKELNQMNCGTKQAWFAPGVGLVKFVFDRAGGVYVHIELAEYSVEGGRGDYFPLSVGNRWVYRWCDVDERYVAKSSYEVSVQKDNRYYIDHYAYAYFSGSQEEYDALWGLWQRSMHHAH